MAIQSLDEILSSLDNVYNPQTKQVQQQLDALSPQFQAQNAALDTARTNAFSDITNGANARGMVYSGTPIDQQNRYVGEKYLPARAQVQSDQLAATSKLQGALSDINTAKYSKAYDLRNFQVEQDRLERQHQQDLAEAAAQRAAAARAAASGGLDLSALLGGGAASGAAAGDNKSVYDHFKDDALALFTNYNQRFGAGATERTLIPKLQQLYQGKLAPAEITKLAYQYRKPFEPAAAPVKAGAPKPVPTTPINSLLINQLKR